MKDKKSVALLSPSFDSSGGGATVASFLYRVIESYSGYEPTMFSVPMSSASRTSVRVLDPSTWLHNPQVRVGERGGVPYKEFGAYLSEFEFQRYRPREKLTEALESHDLVQVVAGTPSWAYLARNVSVPVALQVATLTEVEREGKYEEDPLRLRLWRQGMSKIATQIESSAPSIVDAIFVENQWMYDHYRQNHPEVEVHFAPPGVDTSVYHPSNSKNSEEEYILSVGRFSDPRKNVELLFEAYARLREIMPDAPRLVLAGLADPSDSAWEEAKSLGVAEHVDVHVNVPEDQLAHLYRNSELFVLSSKEEGLGLVIAEAMASGVPVVSTDCGGPSTLIQEGETGYLVPVGDAEAMAERMQRILANPDYAQELGQRGRERIENHFSEEAAGERFLTVYDQLLDNRE
ncbi:glycosyltransferase family 4 protein [Salinibacter ruber]|uniref:glycosyltransferase family 4 protein n=1 Tax=Salinibacter ruber TaxID=146919 RepID=UPI002169B8BA|nr:glycosyltransferase family 4 protein [Salinibacter ruber]MCS4058420.1 glycosyltransferase involved in cell wall biosynthesis [Salinibacter ruber]